MLRFIPPLIAGLLTSPVACDKAQDPQAEPTAEPPPTLETQPRPPTLAQGPAPAAQQEQDLFQITVLEEDGPDPEDPTQLQIPVPKKHSTFVLAAAQELLETATITASPSTAIWLTQALMLDVARAEIVVHAEMMGHPAPKSEKVMSATFKTHTLFKGSLGETWNLDYPANPGSCSHRCPALGEQVLLLLRKHKGELFFIDEGGQHRLKDGVLVGFPGVSMTMSDIQQAYAAGKEAKP